YKIHISMLENLSGIMKSLLSIPDGKDSQDPTREGTELYPLFVPDTSVVEFDDFLQWIYRAFTITDWVEPAVREILDDPLTKLTDDDLKSIGLKVYSMLVKAKELLDVETRRTALVPPPMGKDPAWECQDHASCLSVWPKIWFERIGKKLLHATTPLKLSEIHIEVSKEETLMYPGLSDHCRFDMYILITTGIQFPDEQIIPACAASVARYYKSL
ncbi:hypothetical protein C8R44DRAFT_600290, partial [Mycena epipterygia]